MSITSLLPDTTTISPDGVLSIAGHAIPDLVEQYGTPLYIFDRSTIVNACQRYREAFHTYYHVSDVRILYASKAYLSPLVARVMAEQGFGLDVVSGGELYVAQRAHFPLQHVAFHGNNKSEDELRLALRLGVGRIVLDNWYELKRLERLGAEMGVLPAVLLRVAPDVATDTHRYLQTGHASTKFGFPLANGEASKAIRSILQEGKLQLVGLHAHIGTMLRETRPYEECLERLFFLADEMYRQCNWWPEEISPGGGWATEELDHITTPNVEALAKALHRSMERFLCVSRQPAPTLVIEPGRSLIARAGVAVYRIGARKSTPTGVTYLFVDGGMADNIRPALYGASYAVFAVERATSPVTEEVCIAGRYCESGDILVEKIALPMMQANELLLLPGTGAYCLPMASNYNMIPRPAVILVDEERVQMMERRETYDDMFARYGDI